MTLRSTETQPLSQITKSGPDAWLYNCNATHPPTTKLFWVKFHRNHFMMNFTNIVEGSWRLVRIFSDMDRTKRLISHKKCSWDTNYVQVTIDDSKDSWTEPQTPSQISRSGFRGWPYNCNMPLPNHHKLYWSLQNRLKNRLQSRLWNRLQNRIWNSF